MKEISLPNTTVFSEEKRIADAFQKRLNRWFYTLLFSFSIGIILAISGLVLGGLSYFGLFENKDYINQDGNLMIVAAFALLMLSAHALDKISMIRKSKNNS